MTNPGDRRNDHRMRASNIPANCHGYDPSLVVEAAGEPLEHLDGSDARDQETITSRPNSYELPRPPRPTC